MSRDPMGTFDSWNLMQALLAAPTVLVDPWGDSIRNLGADSLHYCDGASPCGTLAPGESHDGDADVVMVCCKGNCRMYRTALALGYAAGCRNGLPFLTNARELTDCKGDIGTSLLDSFRKRFGKKKIGVGEYTPGMICAVCTEATLLAGVSAALCKKCCDPVRILLGPPIGWTPRPPVPPSRPSTPSAPSPPSFQPAPSSPVTPNGDPWAGHWKSEPFF